jgi:hypothetical protein
LGILLGRFVVGINLLDWDYWTDWLELFWWLGVVEGKGVLLKGL